jgi:hypothetical protein
MRDDFERSSTAVEHRGLRGHARENLLVNEFLRKYLPRTLEVRQNALIVSTADEVSTECDVLICDPATPPLWTIGEVDVVPIECVHAVIEVKSHLDASSLRETWHKLSAIKRFPKTAFLPPARSPIMFTQGINAYGKTWPYFPVHAFVFAYKSVKLDGLADVMGELAVSTPLPERIDGVWTLDRGSVLWATPEGYSSEPETDRPIHLQLIESGPSDSPLPLMAMQLQALLQRAFTPPFRIGDYMGNMTVGTRRVLTWVEHDPTVTDEG